jgi:hypothetical protein
MTILPRSIGFESPLVFSKLAVDALRYLTIIARGWPKNVGEDEEGRQRLVIMETRVRAEDIRTNVL